MVYFSGVRTLKKKQIFRLGFEFQNFRFLDLNSGLDFGFSGQGSSLDPKKTKSKPGSKLEKPKNPKAKLESKPENPKNPKSKPESKYENPKF